MQFNAWVLGRSWHSVALACGNEEKRPALYRSTLIEMYGEGIRLVATDGYLLLKAWVPVLGYDDPEPGADVLPDEVAICSDPDQRVLGLMKYAQQMTKQDGEDTPVSITLGFGEMSDASTQGSFEGMTQASVWFQMNNAYDERIETPRFEGAFPEWRALWFGHDWKPTGLIGFGADGILRLGKLSALWDKASIEFALGGQNGVAKISINATGDVNVSGLVMPVKLSEETVNAMPSMEGIDLIIESDYGDVIDDFLASVLGAEDASDDGMLAEAEKAQLAKVYAHGATVGHLTVQVITDDLDLSAERAQQLLDQLVELNAIALEDDKYVCILDGPLFDDLDDLEDDNGEEPL